MACRPPAHPHCCDRVYAHRRHRQARRAEHGDANRDAASPAELRGASGWEHAAGDGRERGWADPQAERSRPPGGPGSLGGGGSWSSSAPAVRVQAVGLVGAGQPVGEVARALGVHPAAVRRWVWQAWRRWGTAMDLTQPDSPDPPG
jgi:hypothetical protein